MFVRKNRNRSGSVSIQIITKREGKYTLIRTLGSARDPDAIERLVRQAEYEMRNPQHQGKLFAVSSRDQHVVENFLRSLPNAAVHTTGPELIFGALFDRIGFQTIPEPLFRHIVIARLAYPTSKLKTVDYLARYRGISITADAIYRFLDALQSRHKATAERLSYEHTKQRLGNITVVFYDITTLYFEAEDEDDLRRIGFSKDGKFQHPQIMIGLLTGENGFPIGYDIFEGNTFEGHTLVATLGKLSAKYSLGKPIVVADSAMLSKDNLRELAHQGYAFIVGGRIKNESEGLKAKILKRSANMKDGASFNLIRGDGTRLVVTMSNKRAKKERHNREKGVRKLCERVKSGRLTKEHINNRGYNKFLTLVGEMTVAVDKDKIADDERWDGLKGYITNTGISAKKIVKHYGNLWQIEKAFRISKTDLRVRPVFHYRKRRIEAHICIAFVAYAIYKELEALLAEQDTRMSVKRACELTHTMYEITCILPDAVSPTTIPLQMDAEQQLLYDVIYNR